MIVVTTPTGDIGSQLLAMLLRDAPAYGERLRVIVRDPAKLGNDVRDRVDVVTGSHGDAGVVDRAFAGADAVFWCVPPDPLAASPELAYSGFTQAAARAFTNQGVGHVVGVSSLGRGTAFAGQAGLVTATLAMDDLITGTGVNFRALANTSFMENLLRQVDSIRGGLYVDQVQPDRKAPSASTHDIAAAAARLLLDRSWTGSDTLPVLGPEDLSPTDMAGIMSEVLARPVRYEQEPMEATAARLTGYGAGAPFVAGFIEMLQAKNAGLDDGVPRTPETSSPTTFRQWCEEVLKPAVLQQT